MHTPKGWQGTSTLHGAALGVCVQPLPAAQSSSVQGLPSSQAIAAPLQTPSTQLSGPVQAPSWHESPFVQASPSSHGVPCAGVWVQAPSVQPSAVQAWPSSQSRGAPDLQTPTAQTPPSRQSSPGSQ